MTMTSPFSPTDRLLRQFAGLWIAFFGVIAIRQELHHRHVLAILLALLAVTVGPLGVAWPRLIRPVFVGWMAIAYPIGWTVSRLVLGILFYGMFTPIAWMFRLVGRDALVLKPQPMATSFWQTKPGCEKEQYLSQS